MKIDVINHDMKKIGEICIDNQDHIDIIGINNKPVRVFNANEIYFIVVDK